MSTDIRLSVIGMTCDHCQRAVKEALEEIAGVSAAEVDLDSGIATVIGKVDRGRLIDAVAEAGYSVGD